MGAHTLVAAAVLVGNGAWAAGNYPAWRSSYRNPRTGSPVSAWQLFGGMSAVGTLGLLCAQAAGLHWAPAAGLVAVASLGWMSAAIDAQCQKLPLALTRLLALEVFSFAVAALIAGEAAAPSDLLLGAAVWGAPAVIGYLAGRQVGLGDVLFAPVLGLWLGTAGLGAAVFGLLLAAVTAGAWGAAVLIGNLLAKRPGPRQQRLPFGPFLWGGALTSGTLFLGRTGLHLSAGYEKLLAC